MPPIRTRLGIRFRGRVGAAVIQFVPRRQDYPEPPVNSPPPPRRIGVALGSGVADGIGRGIAVAVGRGATVCTGVAVGGIRVGGTGVAVGGRMGNAEARRLG